MKKRYMGMRYKKNLQHLTAKELMKIFKKLTLEQSEYLENFLKINFEPHQVNLDMINCACILLFY